MMAHLARLLRAGGALNFEAGATVAGVNPPKGSDDEASVAPRRPPQSKISLAAREIATGRPASKSGVSVEVAARAAARPAFPLPTNDTAAIFEWTFGGSSSEGVASGAPTLQTPPDSAGAGDKSVTTSAEGWAETLAAATRSTQRRPAQSPPVTPEERDDAFVREMIELARQATTAGSRDGGDDGAMCAESHFNEGIRRHRAMASPTNSAAAATEGAEAIKAFEAAADAGHTKAMVNAAVMYLHGAPGVRPNRRRALELVEAAASRGDARAAAFLGVQLLGGRNGRPDLPITPDPDRGRQLLLQASELGDRSARRVLARIQ